MRFKKTLQNDPSEPWENYTGPSSGAWTAWIIALAAAAVLALLALGCTVTPLTVKDKQASFDGNEQNSGVLGTNQASGGYYITEKARERYNGLTEIYGGYFIPPNKQDDGINILSKDALVGEVILIGPPKKTDFVETNRFLIDKEHMVRFGMMSSWKRTNRAPYKP